MEENKKILTVLNKILVDGLNDINQNMFHSKVRDSLSYEELYEEIEKETAEDLKQAEWLIKRIIFLEAWRSRQLSISVRQNNSEYNDEKKINVGRG